jgi:hypothetical protein
MMTEIIAPFGLSLAAAGLTLLAWHKRPKLTLRVHQEHPNRQFRLFEISLVLLQGARRRPVPGPDNFKGFEISTYISIKHCK